MLKRVFAFILLLSSLPACLEKEKTEEKALFHMELSVSPQPVKVGKGQVLLKLKNPDGTSVQKANVEIEANMTHPGMPAQYLVPKEVSPGAYAAEVNFSMAGDWIFFVKATSPEGKVMKKDFPLPSVQ